MHIIPGFKKRFHCPTIVDAAVTGEAPSVSASKKPTAKEMREAENHARIEMNRKNLALVVFASEGGRESNNSFDNNITIRK